MLPSPSPAIVQLSEVQSVMHSTQGLAQFRQKRYNEAIDNFKLASGETTLAPFVDFYEGLSSYTQGDSRYRNLFDRFESSGSADGAPAGLIRQLNGMPTRPDAVPGQ